MEVVNVKLNDDIRLELEKTTIDKIVKIAQYNALKGVKCFYYTIPKKCFSFNISRGVEQKTNKTVQSIAQKISNMRVQFCII